MEITPEIIVAGAVALAEIDTYANLVLTSAKCTDPDCGQTRVELYRTDPDGEIGAYMVACGEGPTIFDALVAANVTLKTAIVQHEERKAEVDSLEELFNLPAAGDAQPGLD